MSQEKIEDVWFEGQSPMETGTSDEESAQEQSDSDISRLILKYERMLTVQDKPEFVHETDVLPKLTSEQEQQFRKLPHQLFQHLVLDGRTLMKYDGPLVVANKMMSNYEGRKVATPCFFCFQPFAKILEHMKTVHEAEINSKYVQDYETTGAMTLKQFRSHLVNRAWFRNENYTAWWLQEGVLMPRRLTDAIKEPSDMIFCSFCHVPIEKSTWDKHCTTCVPIQSLGDKPTLRDNRLALWNILDDAAQKDVVVKFVVEVMRELEGKVYRLVTNDMVLAHMLIVEFATRPREIRRVVDLSNVVCHFFIPVLAKAGVALPSQLLQFRHNEILTRRLHIYNDDRDTKIKVLRAMRTLVEQNSSHMSTQAKLGNIQSEDVSEVLQLQEFVTNSPDWQLPDNFGEDDKETFSIYDLIDESMEREDSGIKSNDHSPRQLGTRGAKLKSQKSRNDKDKKLSNKTGTQKRVQTKEAAASKSRVPAKKSKK